MHRAAAARPGHARGGIVVGTALLVQVLLMAWLFSAEDVWLPVLVTAVLAFGLGWQWGRDRLHPVARVAVVSLALGGLGMLVGTWIDTAGSRAPVVSDGGDTVDDHATAPAVPPCHAPPAPSVDAPRTSAPVEQHSHELRTMATSWMFVLMVIACVGGCAWLCPHCEHRWPRRALDHLGCTAGMIVGMMLGGDRASSFAEWSGLGAGVSMHVTMVLGMAAGSALSCALLRVLGRSHRPSPSTY